MSFYCYCINLVKIVYISIYFNIFHWSFLRLLDFSDNTFRQFSFLKIKLHELKWVIEICTGLSTLVRKVLLNFSQFYLYLVFNFALNVVLTLKLDNRVVVLIVCSFLADNSIFITLSCQVNISIVIAIIHLISTGWVRNFNCYNWLDIKLTC